MEFRLVPRFKGSQSLLSICYRASAYRNFGLKRQYYFKMSDENFNQLFLLHFFSYTFPVSQRRNI